MLFDFDAIFLHNDTKYSIRLSMLQEYETILATTNTLGSLGLSRLFIKLLYILRQFLIVDFSSQT